MPKIVVSNNSVRLIRLDAPKGLVIEVRDGQDSLGVERWRTASETKTFIEVIKILADMITEPTATTPPTEEPTPAPVGAMRSLMKRFK